MSPIKPPGTDPLTGLGALFAGLPIAATPRGGVDSGVTGVTVGPSTEPRPGQGDGADGYGADGTSSLGALFEAPPNEIFRIVDELVQRQRLISRNHLAQDTHWSLVVGGYPFSQLKHDTTRDVWTQVLPYGVSAVSIQAVPNKVLDLVNKTSEAYLVDFPEPEPEPIDDSQEAEGACDIAARFLSQEAGEQGTNDAALFDERLKRALWSSSSYLECWVDPAGGGYVPLQIQAHPQAVDVQHPLVGPDGQPTTDYVLRYVTAAGQFTDNPSEAAPQWQPKLRATRWGREHVRVYPEDRSVHEAERVVIVGYCTVAEAKRRWEDVRAMSDAEITTLADWTPEQYLALLPPYQRARWKLDGSGGRTGNKGQQQAGAFDEQILFYYHLYARACPDYPKGVDLVVSGAHGGTLLERTVLAAEVAITRNGVQVSESRCLEIPIVQIRPRADLLWGDPTGRPYVELIAGAAENTAFLTNRFSRIVDKILTNPFVSTADSPIDAATVSEARASGKFLTVVTKDSIPTQLPAPQLPAAFFQMYQLADEATNAMGAAERAAQGSETSKERSGKAIQLAVSQNNVHHTSALQALSDAVARWSRIKLEQAMRSFSTPQLLRYEGEDGTAQADEFRAMDFALVGKVSIKAGTGTGLPPDQKVQYLASLRQAGFMTADEATDAARPAFSRVLGAPPNPHEQYVARCVNAWLDGPPQSAEGQPSWPDQYRAWQQGQQAQAAYEQQRAQQQAALAQATASGAPPLAIMPPAPLAPPVPVPKPWTPFEPRPNDTTPAIAAIWERRLSRVMSGNKYRAFGPEWQDVLDRAYMQARQAVAVASGATQGAPASPSAPNAPAPPGAAQGPAHAPTAPQQARPPAPPSIAA